MLFFRDFDLGKLLFVRKINGFHDIWLKLSNFIDRFGVYFIDSLTHFEQMVKLTLFCSLHKKNRCSFKTSDWLSKKNLFICSFNHTLYHFHLVLFLKYSNYFITLESVTYYCSSVREQSMQLWHRFQVCNKIRKKKRTKHTQRSIWIH